MKALDELVERLKKENKVVTKKIIPTTTPKPKQNDINSLKSSIKNKH